MKNITDIEKSINGAIENLLDELKNGKSERLINYLEFCSKFYTYSPNNTILIYQQLPTASKIASFKKWSDLGFKVKKGSKAIRIIAPQPYKYIEENGERIFFSQMTQEQKKDKKSHKEGITYKSVPVFDISQCENLDENKTDTEFFYPLGDTEKKQYETLKLKIENLGIEVIETNDTKGAEGVSIGGTILIKKDLNFNNKLLTLIHEVAHEFLDKGEGSDREETNKNIRELRAESVAYIVGNYIGLKSPFSSDYLLSFNADEKKFKDNIFKIVATSTKIINIINESK